MSKDRSIRQQKLNKRVNVIKGIACVYCGNDKVHSNGLDKKCTKCKKFQ